MPSTPTHTRPGRGDTDVVGARIGAQVVDIVLMTVQVFAITFVLSALTGSSDPRPFFFLSLLTLPLYGGLLEGYWDGQTVGKRLFGIRVVDESGRACSVGQAFGRNAPAVVMPGWLAYLVALASMAASDRRQRLFDRFAGTVVVRAVDFRGDSSTGTTHEYR